MDKYLEQINELVFKEKYTIRPVYLVNKLDLNIKQAQFLLNFFAEKNKNLIVKYGLIGYQGELEDEIGARRYMEVQNDEVESQKKNFTKLISCTIKSIKDKDNELNIYPDHESLIKCKEDITNYQKKGFCLNEKVNLREDKLENLFSRVGSNRENSLNLNRTANSYSAEDKPKVKEEIKALKIGKTKDLFSNFKKLTAKPSPVKDEKVTEALSKNNLPIEDLKSKNDIKKEDVKSKNDIKKEDVKSKNDIKKEDVKSKNDIKKEDVRSKNDIKKEDVKFSNGKSEDNKKFSKIKKVFAEESSDDESVHNNLDDVEMDEEDEQTYEKSKSGSRIKRAKELDSDSDDAFNNAKENMKHQKKKQKKNAANFFDSSEDEEKSMHKFITTNKSSEKKSLEQDSGKLVEEVETYTDEEGFKVHRTVKKVVKEEIKPANAIKKPFVQEKSNEQVKNEIKSKASFPMKTEPKKQVSDNKSKLASKKQPSIMSFFKPKPQSK